IALLVGLFLIYNTVSISVITRRGEIGILRAVGLRRRTALYMFLSEAALFSVAGTVFGLFAGRLLAGWTVKATSATVNTFYVASAATSEIGRHGLTVNEALLAFAICLPLSLLAAALPALEASGVQPIEAIRGAERLAGSLAPPRGYLAVSVLLFATGYLLSLLNPVGGLPIFGYFSACALMFAGAFLVPGALWLLCKSAARAIPVLPKWRVETGLAAANLAGAIPRVAISVAALSVSLAMMIAVSIMIGSFRETVSYWVDQTLGADVYAKPITRRTTISDGTVSRDALNTIRTDPDVAAVDPYTSFPATYQQHLINIAAGDFPVVLDHGRLMFKSPGDARERIRAAIGTNAITVSESFSLLFHKLPGDAVELPTPDGSAQFQILAVFYDYSSNRGTVVMDRSTYERLYIDTSAGTARQEADPSSLSIYLRRGSDDEAVARRLSGELAAKYQLIFSTNGEIRREAMRIFDSTFAITYALEAIAIVVAALGVLSTLITLILERRREIAMLLFVGATRAQIRRMIVGEAVLIGGISQIVGIAIGVALSLVLIYVINVQSFGWTIQYHFPLAFVIQSTVALIVFAALAGLYPAARAGKMEAVSVVRE
ncbi:MAG: FtsX-like permease family protein, partial [Blastocatellia bacterium]